jgi:phosphinothricin acetyltransferase
MIVRHATADDVPVITDIYNALIPTTTVAWTESLQTVDQRAQWFERQQHDGFPVFVAEDDSGVVGYAAYGHFRGVGKWHGYRLTAEHTVHLREGAWGQGTGRALMEALIDQARTRGLHVLVGAIDADNEASLRFHERLGFTEVARMPQVGAKFGRWLDLVLVQLVLDDRAAPPSH